MRYKLFFTLFMNHVLGIRLYPKIISKKIARPLLLDIQNDSCLMCLETFSDKIPSEIHHIDHNSKNNVFDNYVALCCNCHASIHRYNKSLPIDRYKKLFNDTYLY